MEEKELQVENGNFTRIVNPLIENLIKVPFKGCELAVALFIIRKTYGYQKKEDEISLSQICKGVDRSRPTVVKALENLKLVNIAKLVRIGDSKKRSNIWGINKYSRDWKLVNIAKLVKTTRATSKDGYTLTSKDGLTHKRKKETYTKENSGELPQEDSFTFEEYIKKLEDSPRRDLNIIALYLEKRKPNILNIKQMRTTVKRHLRPAKDLIPFTNDQIIDAIPIAKKLSEGWTLETLIKVLTK